MILGIVNSRQLVMYLIIGCTVCPNLAFFITSHPFTFDTWIVCSCGSHTIHIIYIYIFLYVVWYIYIYTLQHGQWCMSHHELNFDIKTCLIGYWRVFFMFKSVVVFPMGFSTFHWPMGIISPCKPPIFTHDKIRPIFRKGKHRGQPLYELVNDLFRGVVNPAAAWWKHQNWVI